MNWTEVGILVVGIATLIVMLLVGWCLNKIANKIEGYAKAQRETKDTLADLTQLMLEAPVKEEAPPVPPETIAIPAPKPCRISDFEAGVDMAVAAVNNPPAAEAAKPKAKARPKPKSKAVRRTSKTTVKAEA